MYTYSGVLKQVIDGDTIDVVIDLGFETFQVKRLRLGGLNAPEKNTPAGQQAKDFVTMWFATNPGPYEIVTVKDRTEKYGRYLATVFSGAKSLVVDIINAGFGVYWDGKGPRPQ